MDMLLFTNSVDTLITVIIYLILLKLMSMVRRADRERYQNMTVMSMYIATWISPRGSDKVMFINLIIYVYIYNINIRYGLVHVDGK
jgi:uncharacterized membrane protein